ncbi:MAG: menaquinone biosynthesis protein [Candidatus Omnitrophica bacterium]|nr:menaquinone biosynthesis protein [Candidatus Omnitrophota bacterium]
MGRFREKIIMAEKLDLKRQIRIGKIAYVNTAPFYYQLFEEGTPAAFVEGTPAEINDLMTNGEIDLAPISSLEYALHQDQYALLPNLCIGSRDFSRSVLLLSRERIEGLNGTKIVVSKKSLSSAALLKILFRFKCRFENEFVLGSGTPDEMLEEGNAVLAIGDDALFYKPKEFLYKYDLSELWWNWAELPFCFSVWAVRRGFYAKNAREVYEFYRKLKETTERNLQDLETLLKDAFGLTVASDRFSKVFGYLFNLNYFLDPEMKKGLELFYRFAARADLAPKVKDIRFIEV